MKTITTWQIAAGSAGRFYGNLFLEHDAMFLGPGRFGPYERARYRESGWGVKTAMDALERFYREVRPGDLVVAREGLRVVGLGVVADEPPAWLEAFDDVHGWDLQHARRVAWQPHLAPALAELQRNAPLFAHMKQIPTFTRLNHGPTLEALRPLVGEVAARELCPLPDAPPAPLGLEELGQALFGRGLSNDAVDHFLRAVTRARRMLGWYDTHGPASGRPTEHEVVAHLVLPMLLALGWSEQLLAVEWRKIDLAAFWATPTRPENCALVCEAKGAGHGLQGVRNQAFRYVREHGLAGCGKVLLSEGGRFLLYERSGEAWSERPAGYLNLAKIRTAHVLPAGTNAVDTIMALTPAGVHRLVATMG